MKPQVIIRADGGKQIGLGHLVRCTSLAYMLVDDFKISFVCKEIPDAMFYELAGKGFNVLKIADESQFFSMITDECIVVLDGYGFDTEFQKYIKDKNCKLVCIDDLHDKEFVADLIINHAPRITPQDYKALPHTQFAMGLGFALLRPAFLEQAKHNRVIEKIETLLICFGGSDFKNLTQQTLNAVLPFREFSKIIVVTGTAYELTAEFVQLAKSDVRIDHRSGLSEKQMLDAMLESELAIVPASGILMESIAVGCIVLSGTYIDNQRFIYENFVKLGAVIGCEEFEPEQISKSLLHVLANGNSRQKKAIDGESSGRIKKLFKQIQTDFSVITRRVLYSDLAVTYSWANKPEIRQFSFNQHHITESEHSNWFLKKLNDASCYYYIMEYQGIAIGSIRFDIGNDEALISYLLDPLYHGKDIGIVLLKNGIKCLMQEKLAENVCFNVISGYVVNINIASVNAFEKLGFLRTEDNETIKFTKKI